MPIRVKEHRVTRWLRLWCSFHFRVHGRVKRQLSYRSGGNARLPTKRRPRVLVPLIETAHYQYLQVLILAKALQLRGADVKVLICGQTLDGCEVKSIRNAGISDPCLTCRFNEEHSVRLFGLDTVRLSDCISESEQQTLRLEAARISSRYPETLDRDGVDVIPMVTDSVRRYFIAAEPPNGALLEKVRAHHLFTAMLSLATARRMSETWGPDVCFTNMYVYSAWEPYFRWFRQRHVPYVTISQSQFDDHSLRVNNYDLFPSMTRFERYVESRAARPLEEHERRQLATFVANRRRGNTDSFRRYRFFHSQQDTDRSIAVPARLSLDRSKRNIFLFPNIHWDLGLADRGALFKDVVTWVLETIEVVRGDATCHLYIKPHPAEKYGPVPSEKTITDFVHERYPDLPPNVSLIAPEWRIRPYDLFPFVDIGVVFTGTLGLEMMLSGVPVVTTGVAPYKGLGLCLEPESLEAYRWALAGERADPAVDRDKLEMFAYFYFVRTLMPFGLTKRVYADDFRGFTTESLEDLDLGRDPCLDHLCHCILDPQETVIEAWPEPTAMLRNVKT